MGGKANLDRLCCFRHHQQPDIHGEKNALYSVLIFRETAKIRKPQKLKQHWKRFALIRASWTIRLTTLYKMEGAPSLSSTRSPMLLLAGKLMSEMTKE
jgi:hypothetical protein